MFILHDVLRPLQNEFSSSNLGNQRSRWFVYALISFIIPFTSSISSNILRCMHTFFGININKRKFYTFMASTRLPWDKLWPKLWDSIPDPLTDGRLIVALDDFINPKTGKKIFGCSHIFDHAAKSNQSKYPWAQNVVFVGLLTFIKGRWACLPFAHRFYLPQKALASKSGNMNIPGKTVSFKTKLEQAVDMLVQLAHHFNGTKVLCTCDSWFGNNGLFKPARNHIGNLFNLLSRLRSNIVLYSMAPKKKPGQRGRTRKYGNRLGSCSEMAAIFKEQASKLRVFLYGARLANIPERRHKVKGRNSFAFSDLRHIIAKAALNEDFDAVCPRHPKSLKKYFIDVLLRMVA